MPCSDGGPSPEQVRDRRNVPAALCAIASHLEFRGDLSFLLDGINWEEAGVSRQWFDYWWTGHKATDARRRQEEHEAARWQAVYSTVLAKLNATLSPDELAALNIPRGQL